MKIKPTSFLILLLVVSAANAQKTKIFTVKPGEKASEAIPDSVQYAYPSFVTATISFRDDRSGGTAKLNYNCLFEEMMFLNNKGDTLALANAETIRQIVINTDTFYFSNVFVKKIAAFGDIKLGSRNYFRLVNLQKTGAMGLPTSQTVQSYKAISTASDLRSLVVQDVMTLERTTQFFIGDKFNKFQLANRNNLLESFPEKRKLVKAYLKDHPIDYSSADDITRLLTWLQEN